ncbi:type IV pilus assembly PilZ [Desulforamulus reducens MI-1]|uniref:Type IV pilus assembly PilZ n=1 Tax=Desulforamulus reducens (strain ATCC BAA-1160 / DSM 100696 / MI-1) TaxID=349161 RepID=A4J746_DESRM|nr:flagellar brake domain-containing protein [Desulforamulus reducens]ABO50899.1 type IV pilus assembly PilZ [Desulforamulus reducens MI-1]
MAIERIKVGQKVTIFPMDTEEQYLSSVYDMDNKGIYVPIPYAEKHPLILAHGQQIRVKYMGEGSAYLFVTEAIGRRIEQDKLPMYILKHPKESEITRVQLREFARVPVMLDIEYAEAVADNESPSFKKVCIVDLSGGGLKFALKEPINRGTNIMVRFTLAVKAKKKTQEFKLLARVMRCQLVDEEAKVYHVGVRFTDIRPQQQDMIMAFVFERMIQIKRRQ